MSVNTAKTLITAPVGVYDVQQVLATSDNDVGRLCVNTGINMWAKCKPINAGKVTPLDYEHSEQISNYHAGLSVVKANTEAAFISAVKAAFVNTQYQDKNGDCVMVKYDRPQGGMVSPYRLSDFDGYNHTSILDYVVPTTDGISSVYSRNQPIDQTGSVLTDQSLPDDSAQLQYYDNWLVNTINTRQSLHVLDLIHWALGDAIALSSFKRGIMMWNDDVTYVFTETIPWGTNVDLANEMGSPSGKPVNVVEFYYNPTSVGQKYYCIPQFSYTTQCFTRFTFTGYPSYVPLFDKGYNAIEIMGVTLDGSLNSFKTLYLEMQFQLPNTSLWEHVSIASNVGYLGSIVIKNESGDGEGIKSYYAYDLDGDGQTEGVMLLHDGDYQSGTKFRIRFWGTLANRTETETFYVTPDYNQLLIQ